MNPAPEVMCYVTFNSHRLSIGQATTYNAKTCLNEDMLHRQTEEQRERTDLHFRLELLETVPQEAALQQVF